MANAAYRIVTRHHGPELPLSTFGFFSASRLWSSLPQCRSLHVDTCNRRVCFVRLFLQRRSDAGHSHSKSLRGSRASRSDNSNRSSENGKNAGDIDDDDDDAGADSETDEIEEVRDEIEKDTKAASQRKESPGFWRNLLGKVRREIDEANDAEANDEANEDNSESEREEEQVVVEVQEEEVFNSTKEDLPKTEQSKKGFWRRWWRQRTGTTPEVDLGTKTEDELLLRDLENLQFRWKDLLEPNPENLLALALTALLALAGLQIIWQMVVVATAITLSALKYTVLAAIIVGLLIFLL